MIHISIKLLKINKSILEITNFIKRNQKYFKLNNHTLVLKYET